jgi:hypothetical protein
MKKGPDYATALRFWEKTFGSKSAFGRVNFGSDGPFPEPGAKNFAANTWAWAGAGPRLSPPQAWPQAQSLAWPRPGRKAAGPWFQRKGRDWPLAKTYGLSGLASRVYKKTNYVKGFKLSGNMAFSQSMRPRRLDSPSFLILVNQKVDRLEW